MQCVDRRFRFVALLQGHIAQRVKHWNQPDSVRTAGPADLAAHTQPDSGTPEYLVFLPELDKAEYLRWLVVHRVGNRTACGTLVAEVTELDRFPTPVSDSLSERRV